MEINQKLKTLYEKKWGKLLEKGTEDIKKIFSEHNITVNEQIPLCLKKNIDKRKKDDIKKFKNIPSNPLLIKIDEEKFSKSNCKVMIFGQETLGWKEFGMSIEESMESYAKFTRRTNKGAFWNGFRWFSDKLQSENKNKNFYFIWNNVSKLGRYIDKTGVSKNISKLEKEYFSDIIMEEIAILKPNIIIFLTKDIRNNFGQVVFEIIEGKATLKSKNGKIKFKAPQQVIIQGFENTTCVKLYHPSYYGGFNNVKKDALNFLLSSKQCY